MIVDKTEVLKIFKQIYSVQEEIKDYNSTISDFKKLLAEQLQVKTDVVSKVYATWLLSIKDGTKLSEIDELFEAIR